MEIIIAIIITFVITGVWQKWAETKKNANYRLMFEAMVNELNGMAEKLGYDDIEKYWAATKGESYAKIAITNLHNTIEALK